MLIVIAPLAGAIWYLYTIAHDQYASYAGFSVRSEEISSAQSLLGGLSSLSGASSSDTDILYEFIQSQTLVERIGKRIDLGEIWSTPEYDPVFAYDPSGSIEDLVDYWRRMVQVSYATGNGLIELRVRAFRAKDAHEIAMAIVEESSLMINDLSTIARKDATRYAREDLALTLDRLKAAREALTRFRSETRIVDPSADIKGQMGLLNSLEARLADAYIEVNLLLETSREDDPRVEQGRRRIEVIKDLIEQERQKFGLGDVSSNTGEKDFPTLVGEFERLTVDVEYAQKAYLAAQAALDTAIAEAQRQTRYLATYAKPSMPQSARYPERFILSLVSGVFLLLVWSVGVLIYYSLRDRR